MSGYNQYSGNPYHSNPTAEEGYGNHGAGGYGGGYGDNHQRAGYGNGNYNQQEEHEMQPYSQGPGNGATVNVMSQQDFLARVKYIREEIAQLTVNVSQIAQFHQRALAGSDPSAQQALESIVAQTQLKHTSIRDELNHLKGDVERTTDGSRNLKTSQFNSLQKDFRKEIQKNMEEEQAYRGRYREQIARQYRIVNPNASEQEVQQAADADWGNEGIFQTALKTNRSGQATAVLGAVRARHNELQKIEQSIEELSSLFADLDTMVIQQHYAVEAAQEGTERAHNHLQQGTGEIETGIKHARRTRKLKWWCALIVVLIIIAIALGVGLGIYLPTRTAQGATQGR